MTDNLLRVYFDPDEIGMDGYPYAWHGKYPGSRLPGGGRYEPFMPSGDGPVKDLIRQQAGNRCERCGHPYEKGMGEWSPCDELCTHQGPMRWTDNLGNHYNGEHFTYAEGMSYGPGPVEAQWRILTVHHLNGVKHDLRWWNLAVLCQRCHLTIQGKVIMDRIWPMEHSEWFRPHAAGWYAWAYLGEDLDRDETLARMDELLALERIA